MNGRLTARLCRMPAILTPDQRVRVFVSSTLEELAAERAAAKRAIEALHLTPVLFELGARPHPPQELYRAYLEQSHVFVAIYWERYGWVAPDMEISGLDDELRLAGDRPEARVPEASGPGPRASARRDARPGARQRRVVQGLRVAGGARGRSSPTTSPSLLSERFQSAGVGAPRTARVRCPLPVATTSFVGREAEVDDVLDGSCGATTSAWSRSSDRAASARPASPSRSPAGWPPSSPDGVAYVPLEAVARPGATSGRPSSARSTSASEAVESALDGPASPPRGSAAPARARQLRAPASTAPEQVADLLAATTGLKVLATSREPLRLRAEHEVLVSSLLGRRRRSASSSTGPVPAGGDLDGDELDAVRAICDRLDGVPLAIELAAARTRLLAPRRSSSASVSRLDFLVAGPRDLPARQQTLRSTIAWSHDLLDPEQQQAFAALGDVRRQLHRARRRAT